MNSRTRCYPPPTRNLRQPSVAAVSNEKAKAKYISILAFCQFENPNKTPILSMKLYPYPHQCRDLFATLGGCGNEQRNKEAEHISILALCQSRTQKRTPVRPIILHPCLLQARDHEQPSAASSFSQASYLFLSFKRSTPNCAGSRSISASGHALSFPFHSLSSFPHTKASLIMGRKRAMPSAV
jgi:hypothetical protein